MWNVLYCIGTIPHFYNLSGTKCPAYSGENVSSTIARKIQSINGGILFRYGYSTWYKAKVTHKKFQLFGDIWHNGKYSCWFAKVNIHLALFPFCQVQGWWNRERFHQVILEFTVGLTTYNRSLCELLVDISLCPESGEVFTDRLFSLLLAVELGLCVWELANMGCKIRQWGHQLKPNLTELRRQKQSNLSTVLEFLTS